MEDNRFETLEREARESKLHGRYSEAMVICAELERLHDEFDASLTEKAENLNYLAFLAAWSGSRDEAVRAAEKCLVIYSQVPNQREETLATYHMMLACVLAERERFDEAIVHGELAVTMFGRLHGENNNFVKYRAKDVECMRQREVRPYLEKLET